MIPKSASILKIETIIHQLSKLELQHADFHAIKRTFSRLAHSIPLEVGMHGASQMLFRARVNDRKLLRLEEFTALPPEKVNGFQRCNGPGRSTFYASSTRRCALLETGAKNGDSVYLSQWMPKQPFPIVATFKYYSSITNQVDAKTKQKLDLVLAFIDEKFSEQIDKTLTDKYKLTAAIVDVLTGPYAPQTFNDIRSDGCVGLRYLSVHDPEKYFNTALWHEFANERLKPIHLTELRILKIGKNENDSEFEIIDTAQDFSNGAIQWTGNTVAVPVLTSSHGLIGDIKLVWNDYGYRLPTFEQKLTDRDRMNFLDEYSLIKE